MMVKQVEQIGKYNEQLDRSLPLYTIICLDNLLSPLDTIGIEAYRFKSDQSAISYSYARAKQLGWHSWEVVLGERRVFFINKNTNEIWPPRKKKG